MKMILLGCIKLFRLLKAKFGFEKKENHFFSIKTVFIQFLVPLHVVK